MNSTFTPAPSAPVCQTTYLLGTKINPTTYAQSVEMVLGWAASGESRYACFANVHVVMEAYDSKEYRACLNGADLVAPDGMPLVWALKLAGISDATRVYGPDYTILLLGAAARDGVPVGFFGGRPEVLVELIARVEERFPGINIVYSYAPPFRPATAEEEESTLSDIRQSGLRLLFVGLGCPKQEIWMAAHAGKLGVVMLGVGAAFDFLSGNVKQAPRWMMTLGLEWCFRLCQEPGRLWRRYLKHNPRFIRLLIASAWVKLSSGKRTA